MGAYQLEAQQGRFVGTTQAAFVVVPDAAAVAELRQLEVESEGEFAGPGRRALDGFTRGKGRRKGGKGKRGSLGRGTGTRERGGEESRGLGGGSECPPFRIAVRGWLGCWGQEEMRQHSVWAGLHEIGRGFSSSSSSQALSAGFATWLTSCCPMCRCACSAGIDDVPGFVQQVGLVLEYLEEVESGGLQPTTAPGDELSLPSFLSYLGLAGPGSYSNEGPGGGAGGRGSRQGQFDDVAVQRRVAALAQQLCLVCVRRRWPALLHLLLPAVMAGEEMTPADAEAGMAKGLPAGATLLHVAVCAGDVEVG